MNINYVPSTVESMMSFNLQFTVKTRKVREESEVSPNTPDSKVHILSILPAEFGLCHLLLYLSKSHFLNLGVLNSKMGIKYLPA